MPPENLPVHREIEQTIARFKSIENKRLAVIKALTTHPQDARLHAVLSELNSPRHVRRALARGVFLSYSRADELFALELAEQLRLYQVNVWLDTIHAESERDWYGEIHSALQRCGLMLTVLSSRSVLDPDSVRERKQFRAMGKLTLPILRTNFDLHHHNLWLEPIDFSQDFNFGLQDLLDLLGIVPSPV